MMYECMYIVHISGGIFKFPGKNWKRVMRHKRESNLIITNISQNQIFFKNKYQSLKDIC
nr:MAG TPA: hypothetical protein [Caudoviricetes sp.]